jgi:hypothetical protein
VERWNNTLRQRLARLVRKTLSFSKSDEMHEVCLKLFVHRYNAEIIRYSPTTQTPSEFAASSRTAAGAGMELTKELQSATTLS